MGDGAGRGLLPWMRQGCQAGCGARGAVELAVGLGCSILRVLVCEACAAKMQAEEPAWKRMEP